MNEPSLIQLSLRRTTQDPLTARTLAYLGVLLVLLTAAGSAAMALHVPGGLVAHRGSDYLVPVIALAVVAALAERGRIRLSATLETSISLVPTICCAVIFGPAAAMAVGAASFIGELRRPLLKWAIYTPIRALVGAAAGAASALAGGLTAGAGTIAVIVTATMAAAIAAGITDLILAAVAYRLRKRGTFVEMLRIAAPPLLLSIPLYAPLVSVLAFVYERISPFALPLFFIPALAAQRLFALYQSQRELTDAVVESNGRLAAAHESFVNALVATLDARDRYTAGHSTAVAVYARDIACAMGLDEDGQRLAARCGLLHDLGKIGVAVGVLEKPGALTLAERREMERHPVIGEEILARIEDNAEIAKIVRHHHERLDGQGYPDGLVGDQIPMISRILAVADSYNAMTSDRPYRDAMPSQVARLRLAQAAGSQLDVAVVAAFERILAIATEDYRTARAAEFAAVGSVTDAEREQTRTSGREPLRLASA